MNLLFGIQGRFHSSLDCVMRSIPQPLNSVFGRQRYQQKPNNRTASNIRSLNIFPEDGNTLKNSTLDSSRQSKVSRGREHAYPLAVCGKGVLVKYPIWCIGIAITDILLNNDTSTTNWAPTLASQDSTPPVLLSDFAAQIDASQESILESCDILSARNEAKQKNKTVNLSRKAAQFQKFNYGPSAQVHSLSQWCKKYV